MKHGKTRVAYFEPWDGGSHAAFHRSWTDRSRHQIETIGLAPRHWQWRMEASGWECARIVRDTAPPHLIACSDYIDLPRLLGFLPAAWRRVPTLCYFHENQWCYPRGSDARDHVEEEEEQGSAARDASYGFSNALSAIRADVIVFNSEHHRTSFANAGKEQFRRLPKPNPVNEFEVAIARSHVIPPMPELANIEIGLGARREAPLRVAFPHRLESDKRPVAFARAVARCLEAGSQIEVILTGGRPASLRREIRDALGSIAPVIENAMYIESRTDYLDALRDADVVVSTAAHEFFGVAFAEAMAAGCAPLAPTRENYPALLESYDTAPSGERAGLYEDEDDFVRRLMTLSASPEALREPDCRGASRSAVLPFDASAHVETLDDLVERACLEASRAESS